MDVTECAFCERSYPRDRLRRDHELDICDTCACGHAQAALRSRGHSIDIRRWETRVTGRDGTDVTYHFALTAHAPSDFAATATFTRENFLSKLVKLFQKEIQVGDPLFDDFVFIRTEDRIQVSSLLQSSGAQSTLMKLVATFDSVKFLDGLFTLYKSSTTGQFHVDDEAMLATCALLVHIERSHLRQS